MTPKKLMGIVEQLRHAIANCGESEYAIAKATGISQSVLNRFVSGKRGISLETAATLCLYLNLRLHSVK